MKFNLIKYFFGVAAMFLFFTASSFAGDTTDIPVSRQIFHEKVVDAQKHADQLDGHLDGFIKLTSNEELNKKITEALLHQVSRLRNEVEINDSIKTNNDKVRNLRYLESLVNNTIVDWRKRDLRSADIPHLVQVFTDVFYKNIDRENMAPFVRNAPYEIARMVTNIFIDNPGYHECQVVLFMKLSTLHPEEILPKIRPFVNQPFADSMVQVALRKDPIQVYTFAQSARTPEGQLIRQSRDSAVQQVVKLTQQKRALFYFPFLDDLIHGKKTVAEIAKVAGTDDKTYDSIGYYKMLIQTEISYYGRVIKGDTPVAMYGSDGLQDMLQRKALQHFVNNINDLHEMPDAIRFRAIIPLNAQDLYYMMLLSEEEIYTSSYKYSFTKMMQELGKEPHGDSLLISVNFDKFKKFIKMAAAYNRLDEFLRTMKPENAENLMRAFVLNLEKTSTLEDAVDVADSYGSITNPQLMKSMFDNVEQNLKRCEDEKNERGIRIYTLLKKIFLSADPKNNIDLSKEVGIPPVYTVSNASLLDTEGRIIEQVFFYGDKDGIMSFNNYMTNFPAKDWSVKSNPYWVEIKSKHGKPIWIFANKPLDNEASDDLRAQEKLDNYMASNNLVPTIIIHRGHSYHLPNTIKQLNDQAKIVMLGSCGGYQNLSTILSYAPDAHIISSKQTGAMNVNRPIINAIDNTLIQGKDIDWRQMWDGLTSQFSHSPKELKETFEDYIPPQKNLGALFIKAYNKMADNNG